MPSEWSMASHLSSVEPGVDQSGSVCDDTAVLVT